MHRANRSCVDRMDGHVKILIKSGDRYGNQLCITLISDPQQGSAKITRDHTCLRAHAVLIDVVVDFEGWITRSLFGLVKLSSIQE